MRNLALEFRIRVSEVNLADAHELPLSDVPEHDHTHEEVWPITPGTLGCLLIALKYSEHNEDKQAREMGLRFQKRFAYESKEADRRNNGAGIALAKGWKLVACDQSTVEEAQRKAAAILQAHAIDI